MENIFQQFLKNNEKIIGTIASVLAIIMFTSLIEIFISNAKGDSNIYIQPIATAFNGFFWSLYAYGRKDWFLLTPNILACILGIATGISAFIF
ncbi:MAG: SemiSWEET family transporter [Candidatus Kuenenbacteria bacterium]